MKKFDHTFATEIENKKEEWVTGDGAKVLKRSQHQQLR